MAGMIKETDNAREWEECEWKRSAGREGTDKRMQIGDENERLNMKTDEN